MVSNTKQVKLVVTAGGNGNGNDHANWADAKFLTAVKTADKTALGTAIEDAKALTESDYTAESWTEFTQILRTSEEVYNNVKATQEETDAAKESLANAISNLKKLLDTDALQKAVAFAEKINKSDYINPALEPKNV